jgi:putative tryptophan/tyrosine transport system substrate-binding protein
MLLSRHTKRREFITLLGGGAIAWPMAARAQQASHIARIACLIPGSRESHGLFVAAFQQRLGQLGYVEGQHFVLNLKWAEGKVDRFPALARELALLAPDVVVAAISAAAFAAKQAMPTTPIVCPFLVDPIGLGLVASHNRPGGNVTGIMLTLEGLLGKQLELAREITPGVTRCGLLVNMGNPSNVSQRRDAETTAPALGVHLITIDAHSPEGIDGAFQTFTREHTEFVVVLSDLLFSTNRRRLAEIATASRLPTIYGLREHADAGCLISYGIAILENWRRSAYFVDRILKGSKPADLPIEVPTKFELVINLKAAKAIGLTVPETLLARADEVIE